MKKLLRYSLASFLILVLAIANLLGIFPFSFNLFNGSHKDSGIPSAQACGKYCPTDGTLVTGGNSLTPSNTLVRTWRGAVAAELTYWSVTNSSGVPAGLDLQIYTGGVSLKGANKLIISYSGYYTAATVYQVEIYDTTISGWRNMINQGGTFNNTTANRHFVFEVYDGFWQSSGNPVPTPLSNFIDGSNGNRVAIRIYSTVSSTAQFNLDRILVETAIDPVYQPASFTQVQGGTVTGDYTMTQVSDNTRQVVLGTAGAPSEFRYSFKNIDYYSDANTIVVVSEDSASLANFNYDIYIWNWNTGGTGAWEKLNFTVITGSTTDGNRQLAKNNVTLNDNYIKNGEVRVEYKSTTSAARSIRVDRLYIIVGSTNSQAGQSETSWGTVAGGTTVDNTRTLDSTLASPSTWQHNSVLEYPASGDYYPSDNNGDNTGSYAYASNLNVPITVDSDAMVTAVHYAARFKNGSASITCELGIKDYSGINNASTTAGSGWAAVGATATTTYVYTDSKANTSTAITTTTVQNCLLANPEDYVDTDNDVANLRLRTSASLEYSGITTRDWDFAFVSIRFINEPNRKTINSQYKPDDGVLVTGDNSLTPSNTLVRTWRGAIAADSYFWAVNNVDPGGLEMQLYINNVALNGANKLTISYSGYWYPQTDYKVEIYDTTGGGQWRNVVNQNGSPVNTNPLKHSVYEVYNGFWQVSGTPVDTPLSNFIDSSNSDRVAIRFYSTATSAAGFNLDRILVETAIDPVYQPASFTQVQGGAPTGDYSMTQVADDVRQRVPGDATHPSEFYYSFKNVDYYSGANTIVVCSQDSGSTTGYNYDMYIWNFTTGGTGAWEKLNSTTIAAIDTPEGDRYLAKNNISTMSDYISGFEVRIAYKTTTSTTNEIRVDRLYIIVGSTNSTTGQSETSWGTVAGGTVDNTRTLDSTLASPSTWQHTSVLEYPANGDYYPSDNDGDATGAEAAYASNLSVPITVPGGESGAMVTAVHYAARFKNTSGTITCQLGVKDYSGINNASVTVGSGWAFIGTVATNAYVYSDSKANTSTALSGAAVQTCQLANPTDYVDTTGNVANLRLRTSLSTDTTAGDTRDWDFGFVSIRYIGTPSFGGSLTLSGQSVTWTNVNPDNEPNNAGKGLVCTVSANGSWSITVTTTSGDTTYGKLWSVDNSMVYGGTFTYTSTGAAGPTYQGSTDFTTGGTNVANYSAPETAWPITVSYTLGTITWATLSGSYTSTHTYTLLAL